MECRQFMAQFSEFVDGRAGTEVALEMEAHRSSCRRCRRFSRTLEAGLDLLQAIPLLEIPSDFRPRLDHRILHLQDGPSLVKQSLSSGATVLAVAAVAVLVAVSAWAPTLSQLGTVPELPALVVAEPPSPTFTPTRVTPTFPRNLSIFSTTEFQDGMWGDSHNLLREYSPILDRRREPTMVRVGIE